MVTGKLRPHDAGIMELGLVYGDSTAIPPGLVAFPLSGHCVPQCTGEVRNAAAEELLKFIDKCSS